MNDTLLRWSVRGIELSSIDRLAEVKDTCGVPYGELVNEAIDFWFTHLPVESDQIENRTSD